MLVARECKSSWRNNLHSLAQTQRDFLYEKFMFQRAPLRVLENFYFLISIFPFILNSYSLHLHNFLDTGEKRCHFAPISILTCFPRSKASKGFFNLL